VDACKPLPVSLLAAEFHGQVGFERREEVIRRGGMEPRVVLVVVAHVLQAVVEGAEHVLPAAMGLHSSTSQLNLSLVSHKKTP